MIRSTGREIKITEGTRLGVYRVVGRLGAGGMGVVYEAVHEVIGRRVAIKVMTGDESDRRRFLREGRLASAVRHPHAIEVTDVGMQDDVCYLVMELLDGESLADMLDRELRLEVSHIVQLALPLADALAAAHALGVVHRDLKPANIILARGSGERPHPKLVDFGVSKLMDGGFDGGLQAGATKLTDDGTLLGTPGYMSPEQCRGTDAVDARSDQYAFGVLLYECASGCLPVDETSAWRQLNRIVSGDFKPLGEVVSELPPAFCEIVARCMATEPKERFVDMYAVAAALLPFADETTAKIWTEIFGAPDKARARREGSLLEESSGEALIIPPGARSDPYAVTAARRASGELDDSDVPLGVGSDTGADRDEDDPSPTRSPSQSLSLRRMTTGSRASVSQSVEQQSVGHPSSRKRRGYLVALVAVAVGIVLVIMVTRSGVESGVVPPSVPSATSVAASSSSAVAIPTFGGTLRIGYLGNIAAIRPYVFMQSATHYIGQTVYEPLFRVTQHDEPVPWVTTLAYDTEDRRRFTLTLREQVMFHPHPCFPDGRARPVRAADLVHSLQQVARVHWLYLPIRGLADYQSRESDAIAGLTALDERRVQIELTQPSAYTEDRLTWVMLMPKHDASCPKDDADKPTGTGPFRLAERTDHGRITLSRFERYWRRDANGGRLPRLDGILWKPVYNAAAGVAMVSRRELDAISLRWSAEMQGVLDHPTPGSLALNKQMETPELRVGTWRWKEHRLQGLIILPSMAPYSTANVALAVSHALDRKSIIAGMDFIDQPWARFLNPTWLGYDPLLRPPSYDPKRAHQLLADAGYPQGKGLPELLIGYRALFVDAASQIERQLTAIGIPARTVPIDDAMLWSRSEHMARVERGSLGSAGNELTDLLLEVTPELALAVQGELNRERRGALYREVEQALLAAPKHIPLGYNRHAAPLQAFIYRAALRNAHDPVSGSLLGATANVYRPGSWFGGLYLEPSPQADAPE